MKIYLLIICCLSSFHLLGQLPTLEKVSQLEGPGNDDATSVQFIPVTLFEVATVGHFSGTAALNGAFGTGVQGTAIGDNDMYLFTYLPPLSSGGWGGFLTWGGPGASVYPNDMKQDTAGNNFIVGTFTNTVDFDAQSSVLNLTSNGNNDIFVLKWTAAGYPIWVKQFGGVGFDGEVNIETDDSNNVYISGVFSGTVDFNPGLGNYFLNSTTGTSGFVCKLDHNGQFVWAAKFDAPGNNFHPLKLKFNGDDALYLSGYFKGSCDFDLGAGVNTITSSQNSSATAYTDDAFICKIDTAGNFIWAHKIGSDVADYGKTIITDSSGAVYIGGTFQGNVDFDPGLGTAIANSSGGSDAFILKLDATGSFIWVRTWGGTNHESLASMTFDNNGHILVTGDFLSQTVDFDPGPGIFQLTNTIGSDIYILNISSNGAFYQAFSLGDGYDVHVNGIAVDYDNNMHIAGNFSGTIDFDPGPGVESYVAFSPLPDPFTIILSPQTCVSSFSNVNITACSNYISPSGIYNWTVSGTYVDTIGNAAGCDSVITINLTVVNSPTPTITGTTTICQGSNTVLDAGAGYASYLWSTGAVSQTINVSNVGSYTVTISDGNGCSGSATASITINPLPVAMAVANGNTSFCQGDSVQLSVSNGINIVSYQWYRNNMPQLLLNPSVFVTLAGSYTCVVIDWNNCSGTSNAINVTVPCVPIGPDVEKPVGDNLSSDILVFPNPTRGDFTIKFINEKPRNFTLFDMVGKEIHANIIENSSEEFVISGLNNGIYMLKIDDGISQQYIRLLKTE